MRAVITGKRVTLRKPRMSDVDEIVKYCKNREVSRWIPRMPYPYKRKDAVWFVKDCAKKWKNKTDYIYVIVYEGKVIGTIGLHKQDDDRGSLGYWIGRPYWGKGFVPEAARLVMKEGFRKLKLHKIYATFLEGNKRSERVMKKLGLKYEGTLREHARAKKGKYVDLSYYGILRREFKH